MKEKSLYVPSYVNADFMLEQRKDGLTLQEIGEFHAIIRERVRQILRDYCGLKTSVLPKKKIVWKMKSGWRKDPLAILFN